MSLVHQRSGAMPEKARPWSATSFLSCWRDALVGCDFGVGCLPKAPSSTPSILRSCSLCRIVCQEISSAWLNTYAQLPMESFFIACYSLMHSVAQALLPVRYSTGSACAQAEVPVLLILSHGGCFLVVADLRGVRVGIGSEIAQRHQRFEAG